MPSIIINKACTHLNHQVLSDRVISFDQFKVLIKSSGIFRHIFKYDSVKLCTYRIDFITKPFVTALSVFAIGKNNRMFIDDAGQIKPITIVCLIQMFISLCKDNFIANKRLLSVGQMVTSLETAKAKRSISKINLSQSPIYLRTDFWFGVRSGGSVGHIAGVLNNFDSFTGPPLFMTTDYIPTVREDITSHILKPTNRFWDFNELPSIASNECFEQQALSIIGESVPAFIYQRYSINNYLGVSLAGHYNVPFVLEYNGSEVWIARNWGTSLKYEALSEKIEYLNLHAAVLIVVVSQPMKDELVARGIDTEKILVNPNGVDPVRYSPDIDGAGIRNKYSLSDKIVIGFIGTFGPWHGAEVLADAFGKLVQRHPEYKNKVHLLMIGDGMTMPQVKANLAKYDVSAYCTLAGLIPQEDGPAYLAACDILASPHVPNSDGTPFFGSPTKLFEYMAMGKGIVASDLDQVGEVLAHDRTAWLVKPGDTDSLMLGLKTLVDNVELRNRLGIAARQEAVERYSWKEHTRRIVMTLKERCGHFR